MLLWLGHPSLGWKSLRTLQAKLEVWLCWQGVTFPSKTYLVSKLERRLERHVEYLLCTTRLTLRTHTVQFHEKNKVNFLANTVITEVKKDGSGKAASVALADGRVIPASVVVVGIGVEVKSSLHFVKPNPALKFSKDGGLIVDKYLATSAKGLYAAGDVAAYPDRAGNTVRIEHWNVAQNTGTVDIRLKATPMTYIVPNR